MQVEADYERTKYAFLMDGLRIVHHGERETTMPGDRNDDSLFVELTPKEVAALTSGLSFLISKGQDQGSQNLAEYRQVLRKLSCLPVHAPQLIDGRLEEGTEV